MSNPVIRADGRQWWYVDNKLHRLDGPAIICADGSQEWYLDGKRHRLDGPAIICADGSQWWYVNGRDITDEVIQWMVDYEVKDWREWGDTEKVLFRLRFG